VQVHWVEQPSDMCCVYCNWISQNYWCFCAWRFDHKFIPLKITFFLVFVHYYPRVFMGVVFVYFLRVILYSFNGPTPHAPVSFQKVPLFDFFLSSVILYLCYLEFKILQEYTKCKLNKNVKRYLHTFKHIIIFIPKIIMVLIFILETST